MHELVAQDADGNWRVPIFSTGCNPNQVSRLLLANFAEDDASMTITGVDDRRVSLDKIGLELQARQTLTLSATELESGSEMTTGRLCDGSGKWRLTVTFDQPLWVMSLLGSRTGHLTNLSSAPYRGGD